MARDTKARSKTKSISTDTLADLPTSIDPYDTLSIDKTASQDQIKTAYRKAALKYHPDKAKNVSEEEANQKFQEVAFAYAILSDERRRKRYDATGNTAETLDVDDDDFDWIDYFREQTASMVDGEMIERIKKEYQGSEEERIDVLRVYDEFQGDMDAVYEEIMCSNVLHDDERFRGYIDAAISSGEVEAHKAYARESKTKKKKRVDKARGEEIEAMELAEELGVKDKLFARGTKRNANGEDALLALIQQRQNDRSKGFLDHLEAKYSVSNKKGRRSNKEPPEEMFQKNAKKIKRKD